MMQKTADIIFQNNKFLISGDLDFSNVMLVYAKSLPQLEASSAWEFDFSSLKSSDSSGLALIIEWLKLAKRSNKSIQFTHLSPDLISIAKAAGIDQLIC
jgi:phospholipid transport system transporter-binding protein